MFTETSGLKGCFGPSALSRRRDFQSRIGCNIWHSKRWQIEDLNIVIHEAILRNISKGSRTDDSGDKDSVFHMELFPDKNRAHHQTGNGKIYMFPYPLRYFCHKDRWGWVTVSHSRALHTSHWKGNNGIFCLYVIFTESALRSQDHDEIKFAFNANTTICISLKGSTRIWKCE